MKASAAPTIQSPTWNDYRRTVIEAVVTVELQMQQAGKSLDVEGLTCEVAPLLGQSIEDMDDYKILSALVRAVRPIAHETLRSTREDHQGQFSLFLR